MKLKRYYLRHSLKFQKLTIRLKNLELKDFYEAYIFLSRKLYRVVHLRNLVIFCIVFSVVVTLMFASSFTRLTAYYTKDKPLEGGTYTEGVLGKFIRINPLYSQTNQSDDEAVNLIFSGLMKKGQNMSLTGDLASKYSLSSDGKSYDFELRKGIKWHDGVAFSADDIIFTIQLIQTTDTRSPLYEAWKGVQVDKTEKGVRFILQAPDNSFLENTTVKILPKHILGKIPASSIQTVDFNINPVGTGPFKFESLKKGQDHQTLLLSRNDAFYGKKPYLDEVRFESYLDEKEVIDAFNKRNILGFGDPSLKTSDVLKHKNADLYEYTIPRYVAVFLNTQSTFLKDKNLRSAINLATDKQDVMSQSIAGKGLVQNYPINPGLVAGETNLPKVKTDTKEASDTLVKAGYSLEKGQLKKDGKDVSLKVVTTDSEELSKTTDAVVKTFSKLGIKTDVKKVSMAALQKEYIKPRSYDVVVLGENLGLYPDLFSFWHSSQINDPGLNFSEYKNPELDKYLELQRVAKDSSDKQTRLNQIQKIILEDVPAVYLYNPFYYFAASPKIKGIKDGKIVSPSDRFWNITDWYLKADSVMIDS